MSHEEFIQKIKIIHNNKYTVLGTYINTNTPILIKCNICGYDNWYITPKRLYHRYNCPQCNKYKKIQDKYKDNCKLFYKKLFNKHKNKYTILDNYINYSTKITLKCNICNNIWKATPATILRHGCPKCNNIKQSINRIWSNEYFMQQLQNKYANKYIPLEEYHGAENIIKFKCDNNHIFSAKPNDLLRGHNKCPICSKNEYMNKRKKIFLQKFYNIHNNNIILLENYIYSEKHIKCKCTKCNYIWQATPANLLRGTGCPNCKCSYSERIIIQFLTNNNFIYDIQFKINQCKDIRALPFDFAIFKTEEDKLNKIPWILIEFDGLQHTHPITFGGNKIDAIKKLAYIQKHDNIKTNFCYKNNIPLIRIRFDKYYSYNKLKNKIFNELQLQLLDKIKKGEL